jgi:hypothetical protein
MKNLNNLLTKIISLFFFLVICSPFSSLAQSFPNFGLASSCAIFSADTIQSSDSLIVLGDIGYNIYSSSLNKISGSSCSSSCQNFNQVISDIGTARSQCSSQSGTTLTSGQTNGITLTSGVYNVSGDLDLTGTLTLEGDTSSIFIFNITGNLICQSGFSLNTSGILAGKILFNVTGKLITNQNVVLSGIIMTGQSCTIASYFGGDHSLLSLQDIFMSGINIYKQSPILLNALFNPLYFGKECGLKYVQASSPVNQRHIPTTSTGAAIPITFNISIPTGATIKAAYIFFAAVSTVSPMNSSYNLQFTGSTTSTATANQSGADLMKSICWQSVPGNASYQSSAAYTAVVPISQISPSISNYTINGIPTAANTTGPYVDANGVTLFIIYKDNSAGQNNGCLLLYNGLEVNENNANYTTQIITNGGFTHTGSLVQQSTQSFAIIADIEANKPATSGDFIFNNQAVNILATQGTNPQMWHFVVSQPSFFASGQISVSYKHRKGTSDCYAPVAFGAYWQQQTSACNSYSCAGPDKYICSGQSTTLTTTVAGPYLWTPGNYTTQTTPSLSPTATTTYTLTTPTCTDQVTIYVNQTPPIPTVSGTVDGCTLAGTPIEVINPSTSYVYSYSGNVGSTIIPYTLGTVYDQVQYPIPIPLYSTGTITFTATTPGTNCSSSASVNITPCCGSGDIRKMHQTSMTSILFSQNIDWQLFGPNYNATMAPQLIGGFYVMNLTAAGVPQHKIVFPPNFDVDRNLEISQSDILEYYNRTITVMNGYTLRITGQSSVKNCTWMWGKIHVENGARLIINGHSTLEGALSAIHAVNGSEFDLDDAVLDKNYVGIHAENGNFSTSSIKNTRITCTGGNSLAMPHLNEHSRYQIELINVTNGTANGITIGDASQASYQNFIADGDVGIYASASNFTAVNNKFENFLYRVCTSNCPPRGYGIYATAPFAMTSSYSAVIGTNTTYGGNLFLNSTNGATLLYNYNLSAWKNNFTNMQFGPVSTGTGTWLSVISGTGRTIDIRNNTFNGYGTASNLSGTGTLISNMRQSTISIINNHYNNTAGYIGTYGISLVNKTTLPPSDWNATFVETNDIKNTLRTGIGLSNYSNAKINTTNNIVMSTAAPTSVIQYGIRATGGGNNEIASNTIHRIGGNPTSAFDNFEWGISVETSPNNAVTSNNLYRMGAGLRFFGNNNLNIITCNYLFKNYKGIRLDATYVGNKGSTAVAQDNIWTPYTGYDSDIRQIVNSNSYTWYTSSGNIPNTVVPATFSFPPASASNCIFPCDPPCAQQRIADIINEEGIYGLMSEDERYALIKMVFLQLIKEPELMELGTDNDAILQDFFNEARNTPLGELIAADTLLETAPEQAAMIISSINPDNVPEENMQIVLLIYLENLEVGGGDFTIDQYNALYSIAIQSPLTGGDAVYFARAMINLDVDDLVFEEGRYAQTIVQPDNKPGTTQKLKDCFKDKLYPNPANTSFNYFARLNAESTAEVIIVDMLGNIISKSKLSGGINSLSINCQSFKDGVYFLKTIVDGKDLKTHKLIVIH